MHVKPTPVLEAQRIGSLDVLRGFASLGILSMNIVSFSMPEAAYFAPTVYGDVTGLNGLLYRTSHLLADLKFMAIFSMLFGAGIILMSARAEAQGRSATGLHYRRMGWLIAFGLLHGHLLWYGDILYSYGMCGLVVYLFRGCSPRVLVVIGVLSVGVTSVWMLIGGSSTADWPPELLEQVTNQLEPPPSATAAEVAIYQGTWLEQMEKRVPQALEMQTNAFLFWAAWRAGGLMLLGMALFKLGVLRGTRSTRFYGGLVLIALLIGLPVVGYGMQRNFATGWRAPEFFLIGLQFNYWASLLVSLGWIGAVMLTCRASFMDWLTRRLAAVGQTAFSNYILQTLICTTLFYGHGLGLYGRVDRVDQAMIVLSIWIVQLVVSPLWLRYFAFGPLEWLWRSLAYRQRQPFRRVALASVP